MKAVILAAGKGTRMRELTDEQPKPMLKVQGKPILEHILQGLVAADIRQVFIVTGFRAEMIESYFAGGTKWGVHIAYGRQTVQDGTGKAPEPAKQWVGTDPFLLAGFWSVQLGNVFHYIRTAHDPEVIERYARDIDEGWWDRRIFKKGWLDLTLGTLLLVAVLGV